jgi:uncharacterized protein (TIGR02118 family)
MGKVFVLIKRAPQLARGDFLTRFPVAAREAAASNRGGTFVLDLVDIPPEEAGLRPGGEPVFDAVVELELDDPSSCVPALVGADHESVGQSHAYVVEEHVERPYDRDWPAGERSPGVKSIFFAARREGMTHDEFARYWGEQHAPLALKHHVGMWRYARNVVKSALSAEAPDWDGLAVLHFRTPRDLRERFYDSDEGRAVIAADVAKFGGRGRVLYTSEFILRG